MRPHRSKHRSPGRSLLDRRQFAATGAATLLASLAAPRLARAETAAEFYRGKTVRILVGSPPGGGYDIYARLVAPALEAKIGATVLVENKSGNGGLAALATLLVRPADGLTIMNGSAEAAILSQMLARPGVTWDVTKLNWLAKLASAPKLWFVGKDARYQSIAAALQADPLTWSATGPADDISDVQATISYVLGLKSKIVTGYRGSGDMSLAVIRNEVDSGLLSADSALQHIDSIKPLAVFGAKRWAHLPDVPTLTRSGRVARRQNLDREFARTDRRGAARHGGAAGRAGGPRRLSARRFCRSVDRSRGAGRGRQDQSRDRLHVRRRFAAPGRRSDASRGTAVAGIS